MRQLVVKALLLQTKGITIVYIRDGLKRLIHKRTGSQCSSNYLQFSFLLLKPSQSH